MMKDHGDSFDFDGADAKAMKASIENLHAT